MQEILQPVISAPDIPIAPEDPGRRNEVVPDKPRMKVLLLNGQTRIDIQIRVGEILRFRAYARGKEGVIGVFPYAIPEGERHAIVEPHSESYPYAAEGGITMRNSEIQIRCLDQQCDFMTWMQIEVAVRKTIYESLRGRTNGSTSGVAENGFASHGQNGFEHAAGE